MILINGFPVDASLEETHRYDSEVTDYPVESGSQVTDNVRPKPIVVTISGVVSNTPLAQMRALREARGEIVEQHISTSAPIPFGSVANDVNPSTMALAALLSIRDKREPVPILTALKHYDSMVMETLSIPMAADKSGGLYFDATFKQVVIVTNERTLKRTSSKGATGRSRVDGGAPAFDRKTILYVISYPTGERARHANLGKPIVVDDTPPEHATVKSFTWDHFLIGSRPISPDGYVAEPGTHNFDVGPADVFGVDPLSNPYALQDLKYFPLGIIKGDPLADKIRRAQYDRATGHFVTPDGRVTDRYPGFNDGDDGFRTWSKQTLKKDPQRDDREQVNQFLRGGGS